MDLKSRFLNYISVHTTSKEDMDVIPSSEIQFNLAHILEKELNELKLEKVTCDGNCYVYRGISQGVDSAARTHPHPGKQSAGQRLQLRLRKTSL